VVFEILDADKQTNKWSNEPTNT